MAILHHLLIHFLRSFELEDFNLSLSNALNYFEKPLIVALVRTKKYDFCNGLWLCRLNNLLVMKASFVHLTLLHQNAFIDLKAELDQAFLAERFLLVSRVTS